MGDLSSVVSVTISAQTQTVSRVGFGTPLIFSSDATTYQTDTAVEYASVDELTDAGFPSSSRVVAIATRIFAQTPRPTKIVVGKRPLTTQRVNLIVVNAVNSKTYTFTINGATYTYTADSATTAAEISDNLAQLINAGTVTDGTAVASGTAPVLADGTTTPGTVIIDGAASQGGASTAGVFFALAGVNRDDFEIQDISDAATIDSEDLPAALATIRTAMDGNDDWYGLIFDGHGAEDIKDIAGSASISGQRKYFFASSPDSDIVKSPATDVAGVLAAATTEKVSVFYHPEADTYFPEAGWAGKILPKDPGSVTWKFKTITGVPVPAMTSAEVTNALAKNANVYQSIGGFNIVREGVGSDGDFIDVERFIAYFEARLQENVFAPFVSYDKIPFTDSGLAIIEAAIRQTLALGVRVGGLVEGTTSVTIPALSSISTADKANRELNNVTISAQLAGAVHKVSISVTLTV